jgi:hypothetical protein
MILRAYIDAPGGADELEASHAATVGEVLVSWLTEFDADDLSSSRNRLGTILQYLLATGQGELAMKVVFILTEPVEESETEEDEWILVSQKLEAPIDIRLLDRLLENHTEELYDVCGTSFIDVLEERLQQCLEIISDRFTDDVRPEYTIRRPFMNARWNPWRLQDVLIPALETAIERQASADPDAAEDRLRRYIDTGGVYWQIATHLLSRQPAAAPRVVRSVLRPPVDEDAARFRTAYLKLLLDGYSELSESEQQKLIEHIRAGPDRDEREHVFRERHDWESEAELQQVVRTNIER